MKLFRFFVWCYTTWQEFKHFARVRKAQFRLRPIVIDFMQSKIDIEERQAQEAFYDEVMGRVDDEYKKRCDIVQSILFPSLSSIYRWFGDRQVQSVEVPEFFQWTVSFDRSGHIALHLQSRLGKILHTYSVLATTVVDLIGEKYA